MDQQPGRKAVQSEKNHQCIGVKRHARCLKPWQNRRQYAVFQEADPRGHKYDSEEKSVNAAHRLNHVPEGVPLEKNRLKEGPDDDGGPKSPERECGADTER